MEFLSIRNTIHTRLKPLISYTCENLNVIAPSSYQEIKILSRIQYFINTTVAKLTETARKNAKPNLPIPLENSTIKSI